MLSSPTLLDDGDAGAGPIAALSVSTGCEFAVAAHGDHVVHWDLTRRTHRALARHKGRVLCVAAAGNAKSCSAGDDQGETWTSRTDAESQGIVVSDSTSPIRACAHFDDMAYVTAAEDGRVRLWSPERPQATVVYAGKRIAALDCIRGDGHLLFGGDELVYVPDGDRERATPLDDPSHDVRSVVLLRGRMTGKALVADGDGVIRVMDLQLARSVGSLAGHKGAAVSVSTWYDSRRAASAGEDGTVRLWDIDRGHELDRLDFSSTSDLPTAVCFAGQDRLLVGTRSGLIYLYELAAPPARAAAAPAAPAAPPARAAAGAISEAAILDDGDAVAGPIAALAASEETELALAAHGARVVRWGLSDRTHRIVGQHPGRVLCLSMMNGRIYAAGDDTGETRLGSADDAPDTRPIVVSDSKSPIRACVPCDAMSVVTAADDGRVRLWSPDSSQPSIIRSGERFVALECIHGGGHLLVGGSELVFIPKGDSTRSVKLDDPTRDVRAIAFVQGKMSSKALSADGDGLIRVWELRTASVVGALTGHRGAVLSVCSSLDGRRAGSVGEDGTVRFWDVEHRRELERLDPTGDDRPTCVVFAGPNRLVVGMRSGKVHLHELRH
jgi:WD40 repeat protein